MMRKRATPIGAAAGACAGAILALTLPAAAGPQQDRGRAIAEANCARCHAVGLAGRSPVALAPPFRVLPRRNPVEQLAEALAEGIVTGHAAMPEFTFDPAEIAALLAYIDSLSPGRRTVPGR
jgi:mono/diheme cytochrome c family protein